MFTFQGTYCNNMEYVLSTRELLLNTICHVISFSSAVISFPWFLCHIKSSRTAQHASPSQLLSLYLASMLEDPQL